jgi:hypothetical protein
MYGWGIKENGEFGKGVRFTISLPLLSETAAH